MKKLMIRNKDVKRILMGFPKNHRHLRTMIEVGNERYILQEATIANIVRTYITLLTHPALEGIELLTRKCKDRKKGYALYQLLESNKSSEDVVSEISQEAVD
jgi:hypothetical protein